MKQGKPLRTRKLNLQGRKLLETGSGHTTHALKNNAPVKVTTNTLGQASASTLLDNYIHAGEEESRSFFVNAG